VDQFLCHILQVPSALLQKKVAPTIQGLQKAVHEYTSTFGHETMRYHPFVKVANLIISETINTLDIIFCRNVLIYFDAPAQQRVIKTLTRLLASLGILFVGASETSLLRGTGLTALDYTRTFAYRRTDGSEKHNMPRVAKLRKAARAVAMSKSPAAKASLERVPKPPSIDLETARRFADAGSLTEAAKICEAYLQIKGPSAAGYYLLGLVRDATGDQRRAADLYRKALYLEPNHIEALMQLALLTEKSGDVTTAIRLQGRASREMNRESFVPLSNLGPKARAIAGPNPDRS